MGGGWGARGGCGGERSASLKWDNKCARHERTEHTLILRETLYLCTHTYTWGMSEGEGGREGGREGEFYYCMCEDLL